MDFFAFNGEGAAPKAPRSPRGKVRLIVSSLPAAASPDPEEGDLSRMGSGRVNARGLRASTPRPRVGQAPASVRNQPCFSRALLATAAVPGALRWQGVPLDTAGNGIVRFPHPCKFDVNGCGRLRQRRLPALGPRWQTLGAESPPTSRLARRSLRPARNQVRAYACALPRVRSMALRRRTGRVSSGASRIRSSARAWKPIFVHRRWTSRDGSASLEWAGTRVRMNL